MTIYDNVRPVCGYLLFIIQFLYHNMWNYTAMTKPACELSLNVLDNRRNNYVLTSQTKVSFFLDIYMCYLLTFDVFYWSKTYMKMYNIGTLFLLFYWDFTLFNIISVISRRQFTFSWFLSKLDTMHFLWLALLVCEFKWLERRLHWRYWYVRCMHLEWNKARAKWIWEKDNINYLQYIKQ